MKMNLKPYLAQRYGVTRRSNTSVKTSCFPLLTFSSQISLLATHCSTIFIVLAINSKRDCPQFLMPDVEL